jgi:CHAT domain-containing protein
VSSYTPTLGALLNARANFKKVGKQDIKLLMAAVPEPQLPGWRDLPATVDEVNSIADVVPSANRLLLPGLDVKQEYGHRMQASTLLAHLPQTTILHLACHGVQDVNNPLGGGFIMHDSILSISELMQVSTPDAFLAFLSACETAKGDRVGPCVIMAGLLVLILVH